MQETLPSFFWYFYYGFLLITVLFSLLSLLKKRVVALSTINLLVAVATPIGFILLTMGRENENEFQFLYHRILTGDSAAILCFFGFTFLIYWWITFFITIKKEKKDELQ